MQLAGFGRLVLARFLVSLFNQRGQWKDLLRKQRIASQEPHLVGKAGHAFDAVCQVALHRSQEIGIHGLASELFCEHLLVDRERDQGVADLVR